MARVVLGLGMVAAVAVLACSSDGASGECPLGTFRPIGSNECVVPADQGFVNDTRCSIQAQPPQCLSDEGLRPYFTSSGHCAPGYRFQPGNCFDGFGGTFGTGSAGAGPATGFVGVGAAGVGAAGDFGFTGTSGASGFGDFAGAAGTAGAGGAAGLDGTGGLGGGSPDASVGDAFDASDSSADMSGG